MTRQHDNAPTCESHGIERDRLMDRQTYDVTLINWRDRVDECDRVAADIALRGSTSSHEYRRARALESGYRAAIEAAMASYDAR